MLTDGAAFDIAVIGGGIHGAGCAQAAAAAGYRTLLLERNGWAAETSHYSSKLIHGGLRYLESAQFRLVHHALQERSLLLKNAPSLVHAVPFYIPVYRDTRRRPWQLRVGLSLYALLTGLQPLARFRQLPRAEWATLPGLRHDDLQAVFQYWDAQTDDAALTRAVVASAARLGAICSERSELLSARSDGNDYNLQLRIDGRDVSCRSRALINAGGPWVGDIARRCGVEPLPYSLVKGSHILLPKGALPGILYLEAPRDGRAVFVMPWRDQTLVGTTEVEVDTPQVGASADEIDYLLETVAHYLPQQSRELLDSFAGVRVLPRSADRPFSRPREAILQRDGKLLSIYGGKLTTYRHTAAQAVDQLRPVLGASRRKPVDTASLRLGD
jgi:glycerol-3-phosphate dehydrogenase